MKRPQITVLMPVYNGGLFLAEAIESILKQTFTNFELLIINDASTDDSSQVIAHYEKQDMRIRVVNHANNKGLIFTLNEGLTLAKADLIARMDADDISLPERLKRQYDLLRAQPDVALVGTGIRYVDAHGELSTKIVYPSNEVQLRWLAMVFNQFAHPTVLFRKSVILELGGYSDSADYVEDFNLWNRLLLSHKAMNIQEVLVHYRIHPSSVSRQFTAKQRKAVIKQIRINLSRYYPVTLEEADNLRRSFVLTKGCYALSKTNFSLMRKVAAAYCKQEHIELLMRIWIYFSLRSYSFLWKSATYSISGLLGLLRRLFS